MSIERKIEQLKNFDRAYFEGNPLIPDAQYDQLKREAEEESPDHPYFKSVGTEIKGKVDLPYPMGSLNQIYEGDIYKWVSKYSLHGQEIIITEKLDGISVLLIYDPHPDKNGYCIFSKAYSRGNGIKGENITRHLNNIPSFPKELKGEYAAIRAEAIMPFSTFNIKHSRNFKNPRNLVAGIMNRKKSDNEILKDIHIVAYELVDSSGIEAINKYETISYLKASGFHVPNSISKKGEKLSDELLSDKLSYFRETGSYELDGVVLTVDDYSLFEEVSKADSLNPEHSVKFKVTSEDSIVETDVVDVHWKISKTGFCKPRVEIKSVELFGSTVTFATGFNAKFIYENGIGPGAKIRITKAGSVIPYIIEVIEKVNPKMPQLEWEWDSNNVEAVVEDTIEQTFMEVVHFFKTLGVENAQETSLSKVVKDQKLEKEEFSVIIYELICLFDIEWKRTLGENGIKVYDSLHKNLSNIKPETLMGATPFFGRGFGVRKAKKILDQISYEEFLDADKNTIQALEGFDTTTDAIFRGIQSYRNLLSNIDFALEYKEEESTDKNLEGEVIVMTGFRDKELQEKIDSRGGRVTSSVSKKTTKVIAQDVNSSSGKVKKARELGIEVISERDFNFRYIQ